jgi:hypothetical protein
MGRGWLAFQFDQNGAVATSRRLTGAGWRAKPPQPLEEQMGFPRQRVKLA